MKLITLLENTACSADLRASHGLSLYLETGDRKLLFDMGPNTAFASNAEKLGVDLAAVDIAVLSHGHYDHAGGLLAFLERNDHAKIYLHAGVFGPYYALLPDKEPEYIGVNPALREHMDRFTVTEGTTVLAPGLTLFDAVPDNFAGMDASAKLKEKQSDGSFVPDRFVHEQDLLVEENGRATVIAGCAHRGIVNIRDRAAALLGRAPDAVVGGFHLFELEPGAASSEALIARTAAALLEGETVYYTGHCTGDYAYEKLSAVLGQRLQRLSGGKTFEI